METKRTPKQSDSLHLYCTMIAHELENGGHSMQDVVKVLHTAEIHPTKENVKEIIFKPIMYALFTKKSTKELTTAQVSKVYEVMAQFLAQEFEILINFPSQEETENYLNSYEN